MDRSDPRNDRARPPDRRSGLQQQQLGNEPSRRGDPLPQCLSISCSSLVFSLETRLHRFLNLLQSSTLLGLSHCDKTHSATAPSSGPPTETSNTNPGAVSI